MALRTALINALSGVTRKAAWNLQRDFGEIQQLQSSQRGPGKFSAHALRRSEQTLVDELRRIRPRFGFFGSNTDLAAQPPGFTEWVIEPLVGRLNFERGIPHFSISIAVMENGALTTGVVYDPLRDEMFWAEKGMGAHVNEHRLRVSNRSDLKEALFATSSGPVPITTGSMLRQTGDIALDLCYVAAGRFDGVWVNPVDFRTSAAGIVLIREAGGLISQIDGRDHTVSSDSLLATNSAFHDAALMLTKKASNIRKI